MAQRKAGVVSVDFDAGTKTFLNDIAAADAKLKQIGKTAQEAGHSTVSSMQASSAAIRLLENPAGNNIRAIERLISLAPGAAQLMQNIFIPVAAFAATGLLVRLGEEAYNFAQKVSQAPERMTGAFRQLDSSLTLTNDELALSNQRLTNEIAKLEGKPQNSLAEALLAARVEADKLADSLDKDLEKLMQVMKSQATPWYQLFTPSTKKVDTEEFGKSGFGGFRAQVADAAGDPKKELELYKQRIKDLQVELGVLQGNVAASPSTLADYGPAMERVKEYIRHHQAEVTRIEGEQTNATLTGKHLKAEGDHDGRVKADEARKKALEETLRLTNQLAAARGAQALALERIDIEEANEIHQLAIAHQETQANLELVSQIYDTKRITEYGKIAEEYAHMQLEWAEKLHAVTKHTYDTQFAPGIEEAVKNFKEGAKAAEEWAKATNKITAESASESLRHRVDMAGITGNPNDPLGTLQIQQGIEKAQIEDSYEQKLKLAANDLDRHRALNEKNLELMKLQNQLEEKTAQLRHKNLNDFFTEMQAGSKTFGDILYESAHSALDKVSADFATLLAHPEKTNAKQLFGGTIKDMGESVSHEAIKSMMERGVGALGRSPLGKLLHIHLGAAGKRDGSAKDLALWVISTNPQSNPLAGMTPQLPAPWGASAPPGGGLYGMDPGMSFPASNSPYALPGGLINRTGSGIDGIPSMLLNGLGGASAASSGIEDVTSSISFGGMMAGGGDVDPGYIYGVNDGSGREFFQPRTAGTIVPPEKMGGATHNHSYTIDARGAQLGVENRIARAVEASHNAAVSNSLRASSERAKRTPRRS